MGWVAVILSLCAAGALAMPGGWYEGQVSDPDVQGLLDEFYFPSSALSADDLELVRVEQQIVSGVNYRLTFNFADSEDQCLVVIYHQEWTGTREVLEDSCNHAEPEPRSGGWADGDIHEDSYLQLLDEVYLSSANIEAEDLELKRIETQLVAGMNYRYTFNKLSMEEECQIIIFHQPWTETKRVTQDTCSIPEPEVITGGWTEGELEDPLVQQLLEEVYFPSSLVGAEDVNLVKVETQVVAGINYRMTFEVPATNGMCEVVIFTQEWTNTKEVASDSCGDATEAVASRSMSGGWGDGDIHEESYLQLLDEVYLSPANIDAEDLELKRIETQVVAGTNYKYTFNKLSMGEECQIIIFHQPWTETKRVTLDTCFPEPTLIDGGWAEGEIDDPSVAELLEEVYFPSSLVGAEDVTLVRVETQLVAGVNYRMTFEIPSGDVCTVVIFTQEWTTTREVAEDNCADAVVEMARDVEDVEPQLVPMPEHIELLVVPMPGGWLEQDVNNPTALGLLEEVYFPHSLVGADDVTLVKVETQVVSGVNYRMTFEVPETNAQCHVVIYTQEWSNTKQVASDTCEEAVTNIARN